jgi:NADPH-dependent 2,4-dienoyl-CoA reductase/sulfur reductase-like enzyme
MTKRLIVAGGCAAGMSAAAKAKRTDPSLEAVVYERGPFISYAACGMPYLIAGDIADYHGLIQRTPEQMARQGVDVHIHHQVMAMDPQAQTLAVRDLKAERDLVVSYDKLIIATGARPVHLSLPGSDLDGIFGLRSLESGLAVQRFLADKKPQRAVIVGGGYIGAEMAEAFRRLGLEVTMIIRSGKVMRTNLDEDMRSLVHAELVHHGVEIVQGTPLAFEPNAKLEAVVTEAGHFPCDLALLAIGPCPNTELAQAAGVDLGPTGAIATEASMETNLPGVYAAGDCAEAFHLVSGRPAYIPLGSTANKQGRVAGENAAGGKAAFGGIVGTMVVRCFELVVASTGFSAAEARSAGFDVQETKIQAKDISHYFPGAADIHVKLIVDAQSDRLLGGQIVGERGVAKRIDVLATALYNHMTIAQLRELDLSYAPPLAPTWDPILVAANVAAR